MDDVQQNSPDTICVRCGAEATWSFLDQAMVEIVCPDCGRFEVPRAEFEQPNSISHRPRSAVSEREIAPAFSEFAVLSLLRALKRFRA